MGPAVDIVADLGCPATRPEDRSEGWLVVAADPRRGDRAAHLELRRREFVDRQRLFSPDDRDAADEDPATIILVALDPPSGSIIGGVRIHPAAPGSEAIGWWHGSRLVVDERVGPRRGAVGAALIRAACARALDAGALRFDAHVQVRQAGLFGRLGWDDVRAVRLCGHEHRLMRWPVDRLRRLAAETKTPLGSLVGELVPAGRWRGDDGVPVGDETIACVDAILPTMVADDPEWAGWCAMLVTAHDLAAMGARPIGALDALAAPDAAHAARVLSGVRSGSEALALPVLGGHTTLGAPAALSVTGLGHSRHPIPAGGGRPGDTVTLTADLAGGWRPGYRGRQWDSSTRRTRDELAAMLSAVGRARPRAAKDVSMAGVAGTLAMLTEASGCGAELEVSAIPCPAGAGLADWLSCFPGFAMLTCDGADAPTPAAGPATTARCGRLQARPGVRLRWPDGDATEAVGPSVTGLGAAA